MKRFLICLFIAAVFAAAPELAFAFVAPAPASVPIDILAGSTSAPLNLFTHHLSVASIAIAAPSYTINEWLKLRRYSRAEWYRMKARSDTPDVIGEGRMQRITPDADMRWLRKQQRKSKQNKVS